MNAERETHETPAEMPERPRPWLERPHAGVTLLLGLALLFWLCFALAGTFSPPSMSTVTCRPVMTGTQIMDELMSRLRWSASSHSGDVHSKSGPSHVTGSVACCR